MDNGKSYVFEITPFAPDTMPMSRLAEYMADLAQLLGSDHNVHFVELTAGSARLAYIVDAEAIPKVTDRVHNARIGQGPKEAISAISRINRKLADDGGDGRIIEKGGAEIIEFPGKREEPAAFEGHAIQMDSLDGFLVRLGGKKEDVPIHFENREGRTFSGTSSRSVARTLAPHLFGAELRFFGLANWTMNPHGTWVLSRFLIQRFIILDDETLQESVSFLRNVPNNDWNQIADPWLVLQELRADEEVQC
ncbi:MAG: hypothetical protein NTY94_11800 [Alphaproteobacteria bacterium]|nr:hypothetical protein [Alphaproteobacteria bacterium]